MEEKNINVLPVIGAGIHTGIPLFQKQKKDYLEQEALERLRDQNKMAMEFIPDLLSHFAWRYADKVVAYCSKKRIPQVAELSRVTKQYEKEYRAMLINKVGIKVAHNNWEYLDEMMYKLINDLTVLWNSVNSELKRLYPNIAHINMCTDATMAMLIIEELKNHITGLRKMVHANGINKEIYMSKFMKTLYSIMDAYRQECEIQRTHNINCCLRIFINRVKSLTIE